MRHQTGRPSVCSDRYRRWLVICSYGRSRPGVLRLDQLLFVLTRWRLSRDRCLHEFCGRCVKALRDLRGDGFERAETVCRNDGLEAVVSVTHRLPLPPSPSCVQQGDSETDGICHVLPRAGPDARRRRQPRRAPLGSLRRPRYQRRSPSAALSTEH